MMLDGEREDDGEGRRMMERRRSRRMMGRGTMTERRRMTGRGRMTERGRMTG
jgi:hypothetical protein